MVFRCPQIVVLWVDAAAEMDSAALAGWDGPDRVLLTSSFSEAIGLLSESRIDVTLVAIDADVRRGERFVRWMRRHHREMPILIATRSRSAAMERDVRQWPIVAYLPQPVDLQLLRAVLDQLRWPCAVRRRALSAAATRT